MNAALGQSTMTGYLGIDSREGLVNVGKRLVRGVCFHSDALNVAHVKADADIELSGMEISWQKTFRPENLIDRSEGKTTLALSAFLLSTLHTPHMKKALVKQMWESGADVIVSKPLQ